MLDKDIQNHLGRQLRLLFDAVRRKENGESTGEIDASPPGHRRGLTIVEPRLGARALLRPTAFRPGKTSV